MIRGICFDWDGTLVDSETIWSQVHRNVFARYGIQITEEDHKNYWIRTARGSEHVASQHGLDYTKIKPQMIEERRRLQSQIRLFPGARELVDLLYSQFLLCVVSYSPKYILEHSIREFGIYPKLMAVIGYEDVNNSKPHPEPFLKGADGMALRPEECLAIGDTEKDMLSAKAAGMY
ncbi:MAG: HAD family phosphatase, partial [Candidatus Aenigmarchaeota archaeon]|nr:HAD family phosphatase [Candidatus Aenigmarchaeota archaeon]